MDWAMEYIQDNGLETEADYPYTAKDGTCTSDSSKFVTSLSSFEYVTPNDGSALETAASQRVVSVAVDAGLFQFYKKGVMKSRFCGTALDHGVTLVGYQNVSRQDSELNYWIIKNSWGTKWGIDGYVWLEKDITKEGHGTCGIRIKPVYPII